jgi:hypothetical protein
MAMQYLNQIKNLRRSSQMTTAPKPVLTPEDEAYLREVTGQSESAPIPTDQNDQTPTESPAGTSLQPAMSGQAENIPLPTSPVEDLAKELGKEGRQERKSSQPTLARSETPKSEDSKPPQKKKRWSAMFWKKNTEKVGRLFNCVHFRDVASASVCTNMRVPTNRIRTPTVETNRRPKPRLLPPHRIRQQTGKTQIKIKMLRM